MAEPIYNIFAYLKVRPHRSNANGESDTAQKTGEIHDTNGSPATAVNVQFFSAYPSIGRVN